MRRTRREYEMFHMVLGLIVVRTFCRWTFLRGKLCRRVIRHKGTSPWRHFAVRTLRRKNFFAVKPILDSTQCRDSMSLSGSLAPLIGPARPFNNSWILIAHFYSMSLIMFDPFFTHWALWVLLCIHKLCQISGVHRHDKNADVPHLRACAVLRGSSRLVTSHKIQRRYIITSWKY